MCKTLAAVSLNMVYVSCYICHGLCVLPFLRLLGIKKAPEMSADNWKELAPVGLWASLAHAFSVLALGKPSCDRRLW